MGLQVAELHREFDNDALMRPIVTICVDYCDDCKAAVAFGSTH